MIENTPGLSGGSDSPTFLDSGDAQFCRLLLAGSPFPSDRSRIGFDDLPIPFFLLPMIQKIPLVFAWTVFSFLFLPSELERNYDGPLSFSPFLPGREFIASKPIFLFFPPFEEVCVPFSSPSVISDYTCSRRYATRSRYPPFPSPPFPPPLAETKREGRIPFLLRSAKKSRGIRVLLFPSPPQGRAAPSSIPRK